MKAGSLSLVFLRGVNKHEVMRSVYVKVSTSHMEYFLPVTTLVELLAIKTVQRPGRGWHYRI